MPASASFVLTATFDDAGHPTSGSLPAPAAVRSKRRGNATSAPPKSTMPDHGDVGETARAASATGVVAPAAAKRVRKQRATQAPTGREPEGTPLQAVLRRPRICFERIVPDALDPERHVRRALRAEMVASAGRRLRTDEVAGVARMALVASKRWGPGYVLRCRFLDGSARMRAKVRKVATLWEDHANVKIKFVTEGPAEVRISFHADDGSWSAVGRDALNTSYFPLHQPTMNFGWVRDDSDATEDRAVVLHEFGHALGCIHEHQSPTFDRKWNRAAVMDAFQGPPNYWSPQEIEHNVLEKYAPTGVKATKFDPKSIMLYQFDAGLFADHKGATNENSQLSPTDRTMIAKMYPR
jgi:hypothetical protein